MNLTRLAVVAIVLTLLAGSVVGQPVPAPKPAGASAVQPILPAPNVSATAAPSNPGIDRAFAALRHGKLDLTDVRVDVFWYAPDAPKTLELLGPTVGVWNRDQQFTTSEKSLRQALALFDAARFDTMVASYGNKAAPARRAPNPMQRLSRVTLTVGPDSKTVVQIDRGEQSPELAKLVAGLFEMYAKESSTGAVTATDLKDAVAKLRKGELSGEILKLLVSCPQQKSRSGAAAPGWLLRLQGSWVEVQSSTLDKGYGPLISRKLSATQLAGVIAAIDAAGIATLPVNIVAEGYTDLSVSVFRHDRSIQARDFSGNIASRKPEDQAAFAKLKAALFNLYQVVTDTK